MIYLVNQMKKKYIAYWKHSLCNSQKLEFHNTFKDSYTPLPDRKTLVKLRISNHKLLIETGRYNNISRSDRRCTICGHDVEDETPFPFHCPRYSSIREKFFSKKDHIISNPKQLPIPTLIVQLMNSTNYYYYAVSGVYIVLYWNERQIIVKFLFITVCLFVLFCFIFFFIIIIVINIIFFNRIFLRNHLMLLQYRNVLWSCK